MVEAFLSVFDWFWNCLCLFYAPPTNHLSFANLTCPVWNSRCLGTPGGYVPRCWSVIGIPSPMVKPPQDRDIMAACSQKLRLSKDELSIARLSGRLRCFCFLKWWYPYPKNTHQNGHFLENPQMLFCFFQKTRWGFGCFRKNEDWIGNMNTYILVNGFGLTCWQDWVYQLECVCMGF